MDLVTVQNVRLPVTKEIRRSVSKQTKCPLALCMIDEYLLLDREKQRGASDL